MTTKYSRQGRLLPPILMLLASGCGISDGWETERFKEEGSGRDTIVAKRRLKQDGAEIIAAAKCVIPTKLSIEFSVAGGFLRSDDGTIPYKLAIDGRPMIALSASASAPDTLIVGRKPAGDESIDLGSAQKIVFQLALDGGGTTNIALQPAAPGVRDVFKACGLDPDNPQMHDTNTDPTLHRPAAALPQQQQQLAKPVNLQELAAQWNCSGDLGDFTMSIAGGTFQLFDDSPWGILSGRAAISPQEIGADGSPIYPLTFEGGPWEDTDSRWTYSPLGGTGTIYYIDTRSGQSAQCTRD